MKRPRPDADRRSRQADRLARVLRILERIQGRGRWDIKALATEEECSERTIHRMLNVLELAGVPWYFDDNARCYRVRPDYRLPSVVLSDEELVDQMTANLISSTPNLKLGQTAKSATRKLAQLTPADATRLMAEAERVVTVLGLQLADHSKHQEIIRTAQWSLLQRKQLTGQYKSPYKSKPDQLRLHPIRLCLIKQAWYLIARPKDAEQPKTYRIARFKSLRMLDSASEDFSGFDLAGYFGNAWAVFRGDRTYEVEIVFTKEAADLVAETQWHATQKVQKHKDGRATVTFTVDGLEEIVRWVLGWSGQAQVRKPQELRRLVVHHLNRALELNKVANE